MTEKVTIIILITLLMVFEGVMVLTGHSQESTAVVGLFWIWFI
jgi:hypothetical protein